MQKQRWIGRAGWVWCVLFGAWAGVSMWLLLSPKTASCQRREGAFVGAHQCQGCHVQESKVWAGSAHAKAHLSLSAKDRNNPLCMNCHSVSDKPHLLGVQCESCHGGGRYYVQPEVMRDPFLARAVGLRVTKGEEGCKSCHSASHPHLRKFDYPAMWKKIAHGSQKPVPEKKGGSDE